MKTILCIQACVTFLSPSTEKRGAICLEGFHIPSAKSFSHMHGEDIECEILNKVQTDHELGEVESSLKQYLNAQGIISS